MPTIPYGTGAYRRDNGNLPELRLVNMYLEAAQTGDQGVVLISRPGLTSYASSGAGPVKGVFSHQNVFGGDVFSVSGGKLYRSGSFIGNINGSGYISFAAGQRDEIAICAGQQIYKYDGTALSTVSFPDSAPVTMIHFHDGRYLAVRGGTDDNKWYWSDVLDAGTWNALSFASAESRPDSLLDIRIVSDFLYLLGSETIERWSNTGDTDAPYSRIEGAIISKGILDIGCSIELDNSVLFVGNDGIVYRLSDVPQRLSDHGIEERIAESSSVRVFGFNLEGHTMFCLRLDESTFVYDLATGQWSEFTSYGKSNWRAQCACMFGQIVLLGDDTDGTVWKFDGWAEGSDVLERLFTAAFPIEGGVVVVDNLIIEANTGWTELLVGQGSDPVAELRASRDAGATWGIWRPASLGTQGNYRIKTRWTRCGMFDFPGAMFEIRVTDPISLRISSVLINEEGGGRSR